VVALHQAGPRALAVDGKSVYWTNEFDGTVRAATAGEAEGNADGGPVRTLASGVGQPWGIAADDQAVYFAARGTGSIVKVAK
jgi:hypothetical protein